MYVYKVVELQPTVKAKNRMSITHMEWQLNAWITRPFELLPQDL